MKLEGDEQGIEALKKIREERPDFLKFLITEARSSTLRSADFTDADGVKWILKFTPTGNLSVQRAD